MPFLHTEEASLHFEVQGAGPPLLFLHGKGGNTRVWEGQVQHFQAFFRCVALDHRGWGKSSGPLREPWVSCFVPDVLALLDHLGIERCDVVAQSMGGYTLHALYRHVPERIGRVVMCGTTGGVFPPDNPLWKTAQQDTEQQRKSWEQGLAFHPALSPFTYQQHPERARLYEQITRSNPPLQVVPTLSSSPVPALPTNQLQLPRETLFISGADDAILPVEVVRQVAHTGNWPVQVIENAGHAVYFEQPEKVNAIMQAFLL